MTKGYSKLGEFYIVNLTLVRMQRHIQDIIAVIPTNTRVEQRR